MKKGERKIKAKFILFERAKIKAQESIFEEILLDVE